MSDNDIIKKVERLTTTWNSENSPDHCLHHFGCLGNTGLGIGGYYLSDEEAESLSGGHHASDRLIQLQAGDLDAPQMSPQEEETDNANLSRLELMDLANKIYQDYASILEGGAEKHHYLLELERSLQDRASRLAQTIDDRFRTTGPDGESNLVVDAHEQMGLISEAKDQHGSETTLRSILDAELIHQNWSISSHLVSEDVNGRRVSGRYPYTGDGLSTGEWRPCIEAEELVGKFACEFEYFPADIPLERLEAVSRAYLRQLVEEAREKARTFRLLEIRLQLLRRVLQEYELYGELTGISEREANEIFDRGKNHPAESSGGRPPKVSEGRNPADRKKVLIKYLQSSENWHEKGPHRGKPKWKKIHDEIRGSEESSLFKGNREAYGKGSQFMVYPERLTQIVTNSNIDLQEIREGLDVPAPR